MSGPSNPQKAHQRKDHNVKRKHKQEPFKTTVGLSQMGCLHGELPNVLGDYDQRTMVDVLNWASENVWWIRKTTVWGIQPAKGSFVESKTLYAALLAAWKARDQK